ncbi:MAG: O-antigen ligase family protein [Thomasclavelia sp.]|nr:O-antigen ligase family protein [Thomasclavelia sp.]
MKYITNLKERFDKDQLLVILSVLALSFPYYIAGPILVLECIYLLISKRGKGVFSNTPKVKYLFIFLGLSEVVSLINQNWLGALCVIAIFLMITLMLYYRQHLTADLFEFILDLLIVCSIFWALYGLFEQLVIYNRLGGTFFKIYSRRENRLNSVFMNSNYYAMMIEFMGMIIMYKFFRVKDNLKKSIYYACIGLLNLFMLYMTGCRTALIAVAVAIIVFLLINKNFRLCLLILLGSIALGIFFIINPSKFPRVEKLFDNLEVRIDIWKCAIKGIKAHPLFGQGPMTYMLICEKYGGHITQHAHSVYLDPLLSFGIIGVGTVIPYIVDNCKRLYQFFKTGVNRTYVALVVACVVIIFVHGTLDYTIFFLHTGLLFMFIASSFDMNIKK